ncbi:MAG: hypothetical protein CM1200mP20_11600 [Pseudomonadota bacterium]|nr:MAG: hypothetical protein CM1200mP20_11600 [Pseudomonadota bacterium]
MALIIPGETSLSPKAQTVLVTGGAGYIGSHTTHQLLAAGHSVTVVDTLYSGHRWAIPQKLTFTRSMQGIGWP